MTADFRRGAFRRAACRVCRVAWTAVRRGRNPLQPGAFGRSRVVSRGFMPRRFMTGRFPARRKRPLFRSRLALRGAFERLDPDRVFLVGALDHGGEGFRDPLRNLELGRGVHDLDRADIALRDAAATADHRQQPARFGVLAAADGGAEPDAALGHAVAQRLLRLSRSVVAIEVARPGLAAGPLLRALGARPDATLAGIADILGRRQPCAVEPGQRRGDILGRSLGEQRLRDRQILRASFPPRTDRPSACAPGRACGFRPAAARCPRPHRCRPD